jgi:hypothetical protein
VPTSHPEAPSDDELRTQIRDGDGPERVHAAFELGSRLGADVLSELPIQLEPDAGVRCHWLTVLASFGEAEAVRAVAEERTSTTEGEHAVALAAQMGLGTPSWFALLFNGAGMRTRRLLLHQHSERVAWNEATPGLEAVLAEEPSSTSRSLAAGLLLQHQGAPGSALREFAWTHPDEGEAVFAAWARGAEHDDLLGRALAHEVDMSMPPSKRVDRRRIAVRHLRAAGRQYPLERLLPMLRRDPALAEMIQRPIPRREFLSFFGSYIREVYWVPDVMLEALRDALPPPWTAEEEVVIGEWESAADGAQERESWHPEDIDSATMALVWLGRRELPTSG